MERTRPRREGPARAILATVAGSEFADPIERGRAQVALMLGDYPASMTLDAIIGDSWLPPATPPLDLAGIVKAMGCLA